MIMRRIFYKQEVAVKNYRLITALTAVMLLCFGGLMQASAEDVSAKDVKQETKELLETLKGYSAEQKDEAVKKTQKALKAFDERMERLENRIDEEWESMDQSARKNARAVQRELRRQRLKVAEWYGSLKNSSVLAWDHMKEGFSKSYQSLSDAWEDASNEFD
jgi:galactokinase/mevalonate kinase-like predicted kinase